MSDETERLSDWQGTDEEVAEALDACPHCHSPLIEKCRRKDGHPFLGCSNYPACHFAISIEDEGDTP